MGSISAVYITLILLFYAVHLWGAEGNVQSPIAITSRAKVKNHMKPLFYHGHGGEAEIENTGHTAKMIFLEGKHQPYIHGGPLPADERYIFDQIHFHWGRKDTVGSEHTLDGKTFSMEAHLVHYNGQYRNMTEACQASTNKDGVAVVAFFIQADGHVPNKKFSEISDHISKIHKTGKKHIIYKSHKALSWMQSRADHANYYTYHGSLTTEPYSECVTWIIYPKPIYVSKRQVDVFRHLHDQHGREIRTNHRSLQKSKADLFFVRNTKF